MRWRKPIRCAVSGCNRDRECKGLCRAHYQHHYTRERRDSLANGSSRELPPSALPEPRWSWEGDEDSLVQMTEQLEKKDKEQRNV
jgi:hypothetical protein